MANALFTATKKLILDADVDLLSDTIKVALIDAADVTVNTSTHDFYDDVVAGVVGTPGTLGTKTTTSGTFDAADTTLSAVSGDVSENLVVYDDTPATNATKPLIAFFDTFSSGMPVTPNGGDITIQWNASGIFSI